MNFYLGIDFGTTGARVVAIDAAGTLHAEAQYPFNTGDLDNLPALWQTALLTLISQIPQQVRRDLKAIAINGTSSTVLLCDAGGSPIAEPLLYNDGRGVAVMQELKAIAPPNHPVISATSSLAKLLWFRQNSNLPLQKHFFLHQADWLAFLLHGRLGISDYHNALKLGYDPERLCYPNWLLDIKLLPHLSEIVKPGMPVGAVTTEIAERFGLPADCQVCAGTTDSIAAFLASGVQSPGEAVTSLGSTLVIKLLSRTRIDDARYGIYSHRLEDMWLVGGASNTGGAVLRQFFTDTELETLSRQIDAEQESPLDYYPLTKAGDRFPINDPNLPPRLEPRPDNPVEFLHGLLESMARIEAQAYQLLQELGATKLTRVYTAGGGAKNPVWSAIRERLLKVPVGVPVHTEAAYGTALLAMRGLNQ
ncbi:MAG: FGGY-family carbohydrate kinase [Microcoleus vaginatus WJT46-NPBG5]|jgi:xylulokinase|nr:FGGY-family carbohydrate kinase [Microcoleus vaginatus WJT46-NPBG5]